MNANAHTLRASLESTLRQIMDPEIGLNIVDLGLIYRLEITDCAVRLDMTMTSPACPMSESIAEEAQAALEACVTSDVSVEVTLVWEPPWTPACMSEQARFQLGWDV
ncbi:MAG TPA: iron-sulfur cluster assembly protein [Rhodocyclaceae bacterium]|nr:iron-sulfur cluster assembly protein [Rhodocyclaceae bacterium]